MNKFEVVLSRTKNRAEHNISGPEELSIKKKKGGFTKLMTKSFNQLMVSWGKGHSYFSRSILYEKKKDNGYAKLKHVI